MKCYVIDTAALANNIEVIRRRAGGARIYAVLKGDAYGTGIGEMSSFLVRSGIDSFAVTEPEEAEAIRRAGHESAEILLIRSTCDTEELRRALRAGAVCTAGSMASAQAIKAAADSLGVTAKVHIEIDTGMGRTGFLPDSIDEIKGVYAMGPGITVAGIYTHFHSAFCSDKDTMAQCERFKLVVKALREGGYDTGTVHAANSSALFRCDYANFDAVRVGSALLGRLAFSSPDNCGLKRVGYIESGIDSIGWLKAGGTVGYAAGYRLKKAARVAIVPVGYYHGFCANSEQDLFRFRDCVRGVISNVKNMIFPKRIYVTVGSQKARVLGHVGMMHTAVDVTHIDCSPESRVILDANPIMVKGMPRRFIQA